jgi:hypothetical protein
VVVEVHQVVRDLTGNLLADKMVGHVFRIEEGWSSALISATRDAPSPLHTGVHRVSGWMTGKSYVEGEQTGWRRFTR